MDDTAMKNKDFVYLFLERGGEGEREGNMIGCNVGLGN